MRPNSNRPPKVKGNHLKKDISLLCLIANENTGEARKLMKELGIRDSDNHEDLELVLSNAYKKDSDKKAFEKRLAEIHPHKDFLLKYLSNGIESSSNPTPAEVQNNLKKEIAESKQVSQTPIEDFHNACGCPSCQAKKYSNACGCSNFSNASGLPLNEFGQGKPNLSSKDAVLQAQNNLMTIGIISLVAIFGLAVYSKMAIK